MRLQRWIGFSEDDAISDTSKVQNHHRGCFQHSFVYHKESGFAAARSHVDNRFGR
jgi:hypothetical protein